MSSTLKAHFALLAVALIYGANYSITKVVIDDNYMMPINLVMFRVITGAVLFNLFHKVFIKEKVDKSDFGRLFLCAMTGVALNQSFFIVGLKYTTPINASLIMTTTPILVLIASAVIIRERITNLKIAGILFGITGAITLIWLKNGGFSWNIENFKGDLMILVNATSYGIYLVLVKSLMKKYHPLTVVKWVFSIGFVLMLPFGVSGIETIEWGEFPMEVWASFAFIMVATTFLAYLLNAFALKIVNPSVVSVYIYLQPVVATVIALLWGKDILTWEKMVAGALIFIGVYLVSRQQK
ncbi:MAG: drug/metabolite transporter (DMT)-like permease [Paraglaciecola sp.]|jgi:drug/metabolite transporter (DMT)-like permease